jgi:Tfp pilus assembly protein PilE
LKKNQQGFGTIEFLIVVIVLSMVGYASYYLMQRKDNVKESNDQVLIESGVTEPEDK